MKNNGKALINKAHWLRTYKNKKKLTIALALVLATLIVAVYALTFFFSQYGSFTISVKKLEMAKYGITLSENPDHYQIIAKLNATPIEDIDAMRADDVDSIKELDETNGSHNGENYFAYTFYCFNSGEDYNITYSYTISVKNVTKGIDESIRIKLFVNGEDKGIWGKQEKNGSTPLRDYELERYVDENGNYIYNRSKENQINKFSSDKILEGEIKNLAPNECTKFTVVMWIEGTDPECTNDALGGQMRLDMTMSVISVAEIN